MLEPIRNWWCHKVLPLVYTDALSYYEMLGKFVDKLNELVGNVNNLNENTVFSVNNVKPVDGNVTIDASSFEGFVSGVNGKKPDSAGEVTLTAEDVGAIPDTTVVVNSVNGIAPTEGNVNVGTVKSVNGSMPDASGNVNLPQVSGVTSVDGVGADSSGNIQLNAVKSVNGITPTDGNVNVGTVKSVNGNTPDSAGNVNAGTVKSVNGNAPDSAGNVNAGTVKSVNSASPDESGNVSITAANVGAIPATPNAVGFQNMDAKGLYPKIVSFTTPNAVIDESWGRFVYLGEGVTSATLEQSVADALSDTWHSTIMNGTSSPITITLNGWLVDIDNGTNPMGRTFTLGGGKYVDIQRFSTAGFMLRGSFTRP